MKNKIIYVYGVNPQYTSVEDDLQHYQQLVNGYIESVPTDDIGVDLICNDEGKLLGLEPTLAIAEKETGRILDIIHGPYFFIGSNNETGEFIDMPEKLVQKYMCYARNGIMFV